MLQQEDKPLYGYADVTIIPNPISNILSRSECDPFLPTGTLPIFTAPMSSVVGMENFNEWRKNKIIPIAPRNVDWETRKNLLLSGEWIAIGLSGFQTHFIEYPITKDQPLKVCIDIANGHMREVLDMVEEAKKINPCLIVMAGNIANPETIKYYCESGIDFARCSIGTGNACITSSNTGVHYPLASLISESRKIRDAWEWENKKKGTKIIADGGIRGYGDVIKALALGADRVMIGGLFAGCLEACGEIKMSFKDVDSSRELYTGSTYNPSNFTIEYSEGVFYLRPTESYLRKYPSGLLRTKSNKIMVKLYRRFYGMASRQGQKDINGGVAEKTAEGIEKTIPITITLSGWVENMIHYLRSAMSYMSVKTLEGIPQAEVRIMSPAAKGAINP